MIYTGYFGEVSTLIESGLVPISIALSTPMGLPVYEYHRLNPTAEILFRFKQTGDIDEYIREYHKQILNKLNPSSVVRELGWVCSKGQEPCLLCYEKPGQFCHRHLVAQWLKDGGYDVKEWKLS